MMKSLLSKILLALISSTVLALLLTTAFSRVALQRGFIQFLEQQEEAQLHHLAPELAALYERDGGWHKLIRNPRQWQRVLIQARPEGIRPPDDLPPDAPLPEGRERRQGPDGPEGHRGAGRKPVPKDLRELWRRLYLLDENRQWVAGARDPVSASGAELAIELEGRTIGVLGFLPAPNIVAPEARRFLDYQNRALLFSLLIALLIASILGFVLARSLARPVTQLRNTVEALTRGEFATRAPERGRDELGDLTRHVNRLAETLEKNESSRRRWTADIAHELRTPLAVLRGELDAVHDGIRPYSPALVQSLQEEVSQLSRLVEDLQTLALSDAGALNLRMEPLDLVALLHPVCAVFEERLAAAGLSLDTTLPDSLELLADGQRLRQLVHNLLENSCRYTHRGGHVRLDLQSDGACALLSVSDTAPGVDAEQRQRLFERFYRAEASRGRASGGSGLGLAICKNIVEAHGGDIRAEAGPEGGLSIQVRLPLKT